MRKVFSIFFYVISGSFFYGECIAAFVRKLPVLGKLAIMGGLCITAIIALIIGLAIARFEKWKRDVGIVITSAVGFTAFAILTMVCLIITPEFKEFFPDEKFDFFGDFISGIGCIVILGSIGILLIRRSKLNAERICRKSINMLKVSDSMRIL